MEFHKFYREKFYKSICDTVLSENSFNLTTTDLKSGSLIPGNVHLWLISFVSLEIQAWNIVVFLSFFSKIFCYLCDLPEKRYA